MIMNSIGVPGASAGADSLLPQSGVYFKPTLHLHSTFTLVTNTLVQSRPAVLGRSVCYHEALALPTSCAINLTDNSAHE